MSTRFAGAVLSFLVFVSVALTAFVRTPQDEFEDRPVIIISSGSVILNVSKGSWVREGTGRFRQDHPRGRDVREFAATTGTGATACTVTGSAIVVTYGTNTIQFGRVPRSEQGGRRAANLRMADNAKVTLRDLRTLVIETTDPLLTISNGGRRPDDTCKIVGGTLQVRQVS
jgi:hypothetical protein